MTFTVNQPPPTITTLSPSQLPVGFGQIALYIAGTHITSTAVVNWGGTPLTALGPSGNVMTVLVPANLMATAGSVNVTVTTTGGTSAPAIFTVTPPVPVISSLSPSSIAAGSAAFTLTINGSNFALRTGVYLNSVLLSSTYVSSTQLTAVIPASLVQKAGQSSLRVYIPGVGYSLSAFFTINSAPPSIASITPSSVPAGNPGFLMTLNGAAFTPDAVAYFGTTPVDTAYISPTQLWANIPGSLLQSAGASSVSVTNSAGTSAPFAYTINPPLPTISSVNPSQLTAGGPTETLTITGQNFTSASIVEWASTALRDNLCQSNSAFGFVARQIVHQLRYGQSLGLYSNRCIGGISRNHLSASAYYNLLAPRRSGGQRLFRSNSCDRRPSWIYLDGDRPASNHDLREYLR